MRNKRWAGNSETDHLFQLRALAVSTWEKTLLDQLSSLQPWKHQWSAVFLSTHCSYLIKAKLIAKTRLHIWPFSQSSSIISTLGLIMREGRRFVMGKSAFCWYDYLEKENASVCVLLETMLCKAALNFNVCRCHRLNCFWITTEAAWRCQPAVCLVDLVGLVWWMD